MQKQSNQVEDVIRMTLAVLARQGYHVNESRKYTTIYRALAKFSHDRFGGEYSHEIGETFLQSLRERIPALSKGFYRAYAVVIERTNHVMEGDVDWHPRKKLLEYTVSSYTQEAETYEEYLKHSGKTKSDVRARMHIVTRFLRYIDIRGVKKLSEVTARHVYEAFQEANDKDGFHKAVSAFLSYAHRHMLTTSDLSILVPSVRRHIPIPSVYTLDEVEKIIESSAKNGRYPKRNHAIVLLAARLGLRSCDIANLRLENIHSKKQTIEITQLKTNKFLVLPLLPEINNALNDYVLHERSKSDNSHIFLRGTPPYDEAIQPHTIYTIVSRIIETSGIDTNGRRRGPHALRSSLATELLNEGNSYQRVQEALGQKSPNAVKSYIKTDIENLRSCALPVPKPGRNFAIKLGLGAGV